MPESLKINYRNPVLVGLAAHPAGNDPAILIRAALHAPRLRTPELSGS